MNRNENEAESFAGNFVATGEWGLFFEVPLSLTIVRGLSTGTLNLFVTIDHRHWR
jgi:hypothetical protein